jgi:outer membrane biosynthesis protein TonB
MEMFKLNLKDKIALTGTIVLVFGVGLLAFTFVSAYAFLAQNLSVLTSSDLAQTFGDALAPLISTCIRIMYLGVMGWIGSLLTIRGVTIVSQARQMPVAATQEAAVKKEKAKEEAKAETKVIPKVDKTEKPEAETKKPEPKEAEPKAEPEAQPKPYEPEIIMLPPKTVPQTQKEQEQEKSAQADQK